MSLCVVFHWTEPALIKSSWKDLQTLQGRPRVLINCLCRGYEDRVEDIEWNTNVDNFWKAMKLFCEHFTIGQPNQLSWQQSITILYVTSCKTFWDSWTDQRGEIRPHFILLWTFCARLTSICGQFFVCTALLRYCSTRRLESMGVLKIPYNSVANLMPTYS